MSGAALCPEVAILPVRQTLAELLGSVRGRRVQDIVKIVRLMVRPPARRRGLGQHFINEIGQALDGQHLTLSTGQRTLDNLKFYAAPGYRQRSQHRAGPLGMTKLIKAGCLAAPTHLPAPSDEVYP